MAFNDIERKRIEKMVDAFIEKRRPPPHIRPELDLGYRLHDQSVEIFEVRAAWRSPGETMEQPVAKATFVRKRQAWKVYWMRADLKWHGYPQAPEVRLLENFLAMVEKDEYSCFFG